MRTLLKVSIPVEAGNVAAKNGTLDSTVKEILASLKPEATYFFLSENGERAISSVFDMQDTSQIPAIVEPWFLAFNAKVFFQPIMDAQDFAKAGPTFAKIVQQYK